MPHTTFSNKAVAINNKLGNDPSEIFEIIAAYIAEIRQVSYYLKDVNTVAKDLPLIRLAVEGGNGDALLALYRNQQNNQDLTEQDLLERLEAETPLEFWKGQDSSRSSATLDDYFEFFTGPQGNSAYVVWRDAQPEGTTDISEEAFFEAIKGEPGDNSDLDDYTTTEDLNPKLAEKLVVEDLALETTQTCQVLGADATPSGTNASLFLTLTCIGDTPSTGTGIADGVITLRSDTNFTWNGIAAAHFNPANLVATRMPNDGAEDATEQRWIVKGAVFDFTQAGRISIGNATGETNFTGSFEGVVSYGDPIPAGRAVAPVEAIIDAKIEEIDDVDLSSYATKTELETGLGGKVTKDTYDEQRALLETKTVVAGVKLTADTALANASTNAGAIMELGEHPLTADQVRINAEARETNRQATIQNATDIGAEVTRATGAESALSDRITTAQNTGNTALSVASSASGIANSKTTPAEAKTQATNAITESLASGGDIERAIANAGGGGGTEGALVLEDLALETTERLCGVSGADNNPSGNFAALALECDGETPTEGTASLGGDIRFTTNSAWNGKFAIAYDTGIKLITLSSGTATQISGGNSGAQEWRFDGVAWDFSQTRGRFIVLDERFESGSVFTPAIDDLTFTFDGELTRTFEGKAVAPVEAIARKVAPNLTPSVLQTHSATIAQQHPGTSFTVNSGNNPLSTDVFTVPTKDSTNADLTAITDGELVKFEVPFYFDTQSHEGFQPECGLVIKADGIVVKTYSFENNNLLDPTQLNLLTFYAGKGETLTFEPTIATSRYGDGSIPITVYPYFNLIRVLQLGVLYNAGKELVNAQIAIQTAKQKLVDAAQDAQINTLGEGVQALRDEYEASVATLEELETRLSNPGYAVLDRATVSEPTSTTTTSTTRSALGDQWDAALETAQSPYKAPIIFDLTTGGVSPSSSATLDFLYVRDSVVYANVLTPFQASIPAHDLPGTVTRGGNLVDADNPIQISLGQDGHHRQTSLTLTPDPNNLPADGAEFHVDFHAVVGGNNRALYESNIIWSNTGSGTPVQKEATNENGESVTVNSFQQGNQVIVQINETGAESLPIAGGYLSLYAHYDYTVPLVPAVNAFSTEVKLGDQVDGHFVVLLETGAGAVSQSRPLVIHYGNGQSIATNRGAAYINFYTNNDANVGNIYSTPYREDRTWDLTQLQANAEAGQADLGFFTETVTNHSTSKLTLDTGLEITNEAEEIVDVAKEIADLKANSGGAKTGLRWVETNEIIEFDLNNTLGRTSIPHTFAGDCYVEAAKLEALSDIIYSDARATTISLELDNAAYASNGDPLSKTGDTVYQYSEGAGASGRLYGLLTAESTLYADSNSSTHDQQGRFIATGRMRLTLLCRTLTG
ncbi:MAG: hypothetical protein K0U41_06595 [Gammaproteobacteria bacterium]|nr:hypothetical protein [Gammaproteobacteria bacterium]